METSSVKTNSTYKRVKQLGKGAYGSAFLVTGDVDNKEYVIKQIDIEELEEKELQHQLLEAKLLEVMSHDNIIKIEDVYKTNKGKLCMVMQYADGGDLEKAIEAQKLSKDENGE